jgi:hypothetical protein
MTSTIKLQDADESRAESMMIQLVLLRHCPRKRAMTQ